VNPPPRSSQTGPPQAQQQQEQAAHRPRSRKRQFHGAMANCQMCGKEYEMGPGNYLAHMVAQKHIRKIGTGPHTPTTRM
jgi:hypothetical protein